MKEGVDQLSNEDAASLRAYRWFIGSLHEQLKPLHELEQGEVLLHLKVNDDNIPQSLILSVNDPQLTAEIYQLLMKIPRTRNKFINIPKGGSDVLN